MCCLAAATQGMDKTANKGARPIHNEVGRGTIQRPFSPADLLRRYPGLTPEKFGSHGKADKIQDLLVLAPYLGCVILGQWLTDTLEKLFTRRVPIFITFTITALGSISEAILQSRPNSFVARFVLGLGIGTKSATVPIYAAKCAPPPIRGASGMQWQV